MNAAYSLFSTHAPAELQAGDTAAALARVNYPIGLDLQGTEHDTPQIWPWFRNAVGDAKALRVRAAVEKIVAQKPAELDEDDAANQQAYAFATNAQSLLARLDGVGVSPCDEELRRALTTIIQISDDQPTIEAFTDVLQLGYQSKAQSVLGRDATADDFVEATEQAAIAQQADRGIDYDKKALQLSVNLTADGRENVSCRVTPAAIVNGQQVKAEAVAFSNHTPLNVKQQALIDTVLTAVRNYLEA